MAKKEQKAGDAASSAWDRNPAAAAEGEGELFLQFPIPALGQCALPIEAVQVVAEAGGPFRRVPGRGGAGKRFLGLVSVRGQVQLLFDLSLQVAKQPMVALNREEYGAAVSAEGASLAALAQEGRLGGESQAEPLAALGRGEHLVVAVAAGGRTLALRIGAQLRLVRCLPQADAPSPPSTEFAPLVCGCFYPAKGAEAVEPVWLLDVDKLFILLEQEVAHG